MHFSGNKARVGPVMYLSNLAACQWFSLNPENYFEANTTIRWSNTMNLEYVTMMHWVVVAKLCKSK